jgi:malonyl-CoA O-methyltransferase
MSVSLDSALPEAGATRRSFDRAATFDRASFVHDETRSRLFERLDLVDLEPRVAVDLGCATGRGAAALAARYPTARVLAVDSSAGMLRAARAGAAELPSVAVLGGDAERLPLRDHSVQLVLANLVLPWCRPPALFAETARVLEAGGLLLFATLGPDSLKELREAWGAVDSALHVHAAFDLHDVGDLALAAGLAEPVLDVDRLAITYSSVARLVDDLRSCAAVRTHGPAPLAGVRACARGRWQRCPLLDHARARARPSVGPRAEGCATQRGLGRDRGPADDSAAARHEAISRFHNRRSSRLC